MSRPISPAIRSKSQCGTLLTGSDLWQRQNRPAAVAVRRNAEPDFCWPPEVEAKSTVARSGRRTIARTNAQRLASAQARVLHGRRPTWRVAGAPFEIRPQSRSFRRGPRRKLYWGPRRFCVIGQTLRPGPMTRASWDRFYDRRMMTCPLCRDGKERGWLCAEHFAKPCEHFGCDAEVIACVCNPKSAVLWREVYAEVPSDKPRELDHRRDARFGQLAKPGRLRQMGAGAPGPR